MRDRLRQHRCEARPLGETIDTGPAEPLCAPQARPAAAPVTTPRAMSAKPLETEQAGVTEPAAQRVAGPPDADAPPGSDPALAQAVR
ncbi:MAG: hypothetical protein ACREU4_08030, partial [Burkholderiales bacterium]